jgi:hypothetical protein
MSQADAALIADLVARVEALETAVEELKTKSRDMMDEIYGTEQPNHTADRAARKAVGAKA